ncbi:MAG: hypothetical protein BWY66_00141 [bacterium ADurb.Bin374]|nr:MAG: hypothetical protein BWY66_00141 [bacterium ADurb.Bin374]
MWILGRQRDVPEPRESRQIEDGSFTSLVSISHELAEAQDIVEVEDLRGVGGGVHGHGEWPVELGPHVVEDDLRHDISGGNRRYAARIDDYQGRGAVRRRPIDISLCQCGACIFITIYRMGGGVDGHGENLTKIAVLHLGEQWGQIAQKGDVIGDGLSDGGFSVISAVNRAVRDILRRIRMERKTEANKDSQGDERPSKHFDGEPQAVEKG